MSLASYQAAPPRDIVLPNPQKNLIQNQQVLLAENFKSLVPSDRHTIGELEDCQSLFSQFLSSHGQFHE